MITNKIDRILIIAVLFLSLSCGTSKISGTLDSREVVKLMVENPQKAKRSYDEQVVTIKGHISETYKNKQGAIVIVLGYKRDADGLVCTLKKNQQFLVPLRQNQSIEIKGYSIFADGKVQIINGIILNMN